MSNSVIEIKNITFSYDYDNNNYALNNVSIDIEKGSYTVIVGHNGSGKSTLAKLLIGLLEPKEGKIIVDNEELSIDSIYKIRTIRFKVGIVFQNPDNQFIGATVEDDIAFGLENHLVAQEEMRGIIEEYATKTVFPPKEKIFNSLNYVPLDKIKVVIIGQDPYHDDGQAEGLAFSVAENIPLPPSLKNA